MSRWSLQRPGLRRVAILLGCLLLAGCAQSSLLEGLDERQANEVVAVMLRNNIEADKVPEGKAGFRVVVAGGDLPEAIDLVQQNSLPSAARSQVSGAFPADALVSTPLGERARLLSAIEQRLEESLGVLHGVREARVHVSYDAVGGQGVQPSKEPKMHVAAVLVHEGHVDAASLMPSVKRFLRNTFVEVDYDNISVILTPASPPRALLAVAAGKSAQPGWGWMAVALILGVLLLGLAWLLRNKPSQAAALWQRTRAKVKRNTRRGATGASAS